MLLKNGEGVSMVSIKKILFIFGVFAWLFFIIMLATSCNLPDLPEDKTPTGTPAKEVKCGPYKWNNRSWDRALCSAIKENDLLKLKPSDIKTFNGKENNLDFWGNILVEMARFESKFNPETTYKESFKDRFGKHVISSGLFQISVESLLGYKIKVKQKELLDPYINIKSATKVFSTLVKRDGCIACKGIKDPNNKWDKGFRGGGRYWSVLRGTRDYTKKALTAIKSANK